jgi:hypothetical protein
MLDCPPLTDDPPTLNRARWRQRGGLTAKLPDRPRARDSVATLNPGDTAAELGVIELFGVDGEADRE